MLRFLLATLGCVVKAAKWGEYTYISLYGAYPSVDLHDCAEVVMEDDAPFIAVNLPFLFPWYGTLFNRTWISPNGALHFDKKPPCCQSTNSCMFLGGSCNLDNYWNNIAGCTTDLDPSEGGRIHYCVERQRLRVFFSYIPLFFIQNYRGWGRNETYSFYIEINSSGRINVGYQQVADPRNIPGWTSTDDTYGDRLWMVGLRPPQGYTTLQSAHQAEWGLRANGTYPPRSAIRSGSRVVFYPFAPEACSSPLRGPAGTTVYIVMHPLGGETNASVWDNWKLFCRFGSFSTPVPAFYNRSNGFLQCVAPAVMGTTALSVWTAEEPIITNLTFSFSFQTDMSDPCTLCMSHLARCWQDCNGDWEGTAFVDECGMCVGGRTGRHAGESKDCKGICYGPFAKVEGSCVCRTPLCALITTRPQFGGVSPLLYAPSSQYLMFASSSLPPVLTGWKMWTSEDFLTNVFLPFSFSFYGVNISNIRVSQQGAVFGNLAAKCDVLPPLSRTDNGTVLCPTNYSLIAGFFSEASTRPGKIESAVSNKVFAIRYREVKLPPTAGVFGELNCSSCIANFSMYIFHDGRLAIHLESVFDPSLYLRSSFVGVMGPLANASGVPGTNSSGSAVIRPATEVLSRSNGRPVGFCQMGTLLCLSPKWGPPAGGNKVRVSSAFLDCASLNLLAFDCSFGGIRSPASFRNSTNTLDCVVPPGLSGDTVAFELLIRATGTPVAQSRNGEKPAGYNTLNTSQYRFLDFTHTTLLYSYLTRPHNESSTSLTEELCNDCGNLNHKFCTMDCNGDWGGAAYRDSCGECQGGKAGDKPNRARDCHGLCFGNSRITSGQCFCAGSNPCFSGGFSRLQNKKLLQRQYVMHAATSTPEKAALDLSKTNPVQCSRDNITRVVLPFTFRYWGVPLREIFLSPLGGVFLSLPLPGCPALPSSAEFTSSQWTPSGECQWNVIAASLARYSLTSASVSCAVSSSVFNVKFSGLQLAGSSNSATKHAFHISLFASSDIAVWYEEMSEQGHGASWLAGIAQPWASSIPVMNAIYGQPQRRGVVGEEAVAQALVHEQTEWHLNSSYPTGLFPRRHQLGSRTMLRYCALTIEPCMWPGRGSLSAPQEVSIALSDNASVVDCLLTGGFVAQCSFGGFLVPAYFSAKAKGVKCMSPLPGSWTSATVLVSVVLDGVVVPSSAPLFFTYSTSQTSSSSSLGECACATLMPESCPMDCTGTVLGSAVVDKCGLCGGGRSGEVTDAMLDCEGLCFGPFQTYDVAKSDGNKALVCGCSLSDPMCAKRQRSNGPVRLSSASASLDRYHSFLISVLVTTLGVFLLHWLWKCLRGYISRKRRVNPIGLDDSTVLTVENNSRAYAVALMEMTERSRQSEENQLEFPSQDPD